MNYTADEVNAIATLAKMANRLRSEDKIDSLELIFMPTNIQIVATISRRVSVACGVGAEEFRGLLGALAERA